MTVAEGSAYSESQDEYLTSESSSDDSSDNGNEDDIYILITKYIIC